MDSRFGQHPHARTGIHFIPYMSAPPSCHSFSIHGNRSCDSQQCVETLQVVHGDPQLLQLCSICTTKVWLLALCPGHIWHLVFLDQECQPGSYLRPPCLETQVSSLRTEISSICHGSPLGGLWGGHALDTCVLCPALASGAVEDAI